MNPKTVLLYDENSVIAMLLAGTLEELGYAVHQTYSVEAALLCLSANPDITLVIADLGMGLATGSQVLIVSKAQDGKRAVIVSSADFFDNGGEERLREAGAGFFLKKPFTLGVFRATVEKAIPPTIYDVIFFLAQNSVEGRSPTRAFNECLVAEHGKSALGLPHNTLLGEKTQVAFRQLRDMK